MDFMYNRRVSLSSQSAQLKWKNEIRKKMKLADETETVFCGNSANNSDEEKDKNENKNDNKNKNDINKNELNINNLNKIDSNNNNNNKNDENKLKIEKDKADTDKNKSEEICVYQSTIQYSGKSFIRKMFITFVRIFNLAYFSSAFIVKLQKL